MTISHTVRNAGPAAAGPFVIRFFCRPTTRRTAPTCSWAPARSVDAPPARAVLPPSARPCPATTAAGTYRIVAIADAVGQQAELDETNDVALSALLSVAR
jgi:hypothetical protein